VVQEERADGAGGVAVGPDGVCAGGVALEGLLSHQELGLSRDGGIGGLGRIRHAVGEHEDFDEGRLGESVAGVSVVVESGVARLALDA
jgi:hypothetical protein